MKFRPFVLTASIAHALVCASPAVPPGTAAHGETSVPAAASADGQNALKSFKMDGGIRAELFAAEPLLANGVAFTVDEKGRWYIAESYRQEKGIEDNRAHNNWLDEDIAARSIEDRLKMIHKYYPDAAKFSEKFEKFEDRIVAVQDSDGDGKADKTTIYADGFRDALDGTGAGLLARGSELWWTCIPNLWRFEDKDGDGKAEVRDKMLTGFGVKYAFRGHDMHGLRFGPDGKLYFSIGDRGINVKSKEGKDWVEPETGSIMRCNPDGTGFEVFATGVRNPQELAFNEFGDLFTGDNNSDAGDKARFVHLVEGGDCGWRMAYQYLNDRGPWNRELLWDDKEGIKAKYIIPPIINVSNGPSGLTFNPGTGLSDKYKGHFFLSDFRGGASASVVHDLVTEPAGAWFKMKEHHDLIKGVLTTDVEFGNDGSLYVLDWVESWGGVNKGRIYKLTADAADTSLQRETQQLISEGMSKRPEGELVKLLAHADLRVRQAAQFQLAGKGDASAGAFVKLASDKAAPQLARLHAIWGLGQIGEKKAEAVRPLLSLLADADPEVRAQSAKVLGESKLTAAAEPLVALLKDANSRARYFAALSLGKLKHAPAFEPLCAMLAENNDVDPILRHGGVMGLMSTAKPEQLAAKAGDASNAVKIGALLALRRQKSPLISAFLKDADEGVVLETARAVHDVPIAEALPALGALVGNPAVKNPRTLERAINANYRLGKAENARALAEFAKSSAPEDARKDALNALADWGNPNSKDRLLNLWRPLPNRPADDAVAAVTATVPALLKDAPGSVQEMAAKLAGKLSIGAAGEPLALLAMNDKAAGGARVAALQSLASLKDARLGAAAKSAITSSDAKVRGEALQALSTQDPSAAVKLVSELIASGSPGEKQGALLALTQIKDPAAKTQLSALMQQLIAGQAAPEIQLDIYEAAKKAGLNDLVQKYKDGLPKDDPLAPFKLSFAGGDAARGKKVFWEHQQAQCIKCHKAEGGDSIVGPDLTHVGATKDRAYILESIVFPNRKISEGFQIVSLMLNNGNAVAGKLVSEDAGAVRVETVGTDSKPLVITVPVPQIKERITAISPMPENLRDLLSRSELRDLVEYLVTRK